MSRKTLHNYSNNLAFLITIKSAWVLHFLVRLPPNVADVLLESPATVDYEYRGEKENIGGTIRLLNNNKVEFWNKILFIKTKHHWYLVSDVLEVNRGTSDFTVDVLCPPTDHEDEEVIRYNYRVADEDDAENWVTTLSSRIGRPTSSKLPAAEVREPQVDEAKLEISIARLSLKSNATEAAEILKRKPAQAGLLVSLGLVMWYWAWQIFTGATEGTPDQAVGVFFVGLGGMIFGIYRARQLIISSADAGGVGKHFTKRNFGFALIILWLAFWYGAYKRYLDGQSLLQTNLQLSREVMLQAAVLVMVGLFALGVGYRLVNPVKSQYVKDIEQHGYPRRIPNRVRYEVWHRDNGRCQYPNCGSTEDLHFDHIIPYSKGGSSTDPENIQLLCGKHNLEKSDRI